MVARDVLFGGNGGRRRFRVRAEHSGSEDLNVFSFFSKVFSVVWQGQLYPYPPCMHTCKLSLSSNAEIYYQKNEMRSPF
jgi:hypothetical protein